MQSTNIRQIKAALWEQAFLGTVQVSCPMGPVVAIRRRKGQLRVMIRGWGRWYDVPSVRIERAGQELLQQAPSTVSSALCLSALGQPKRAQVRDGDAGNDVGNGANDQRPGLLVDDAYRSVMRIAAGGEGNQRSS